MRPVVSNTYIENSQFGAGRLLVTRAAPYRLPMQPLRGPALVPPAGRGDILVAITQAWSHIWMCAAKTMCSLWCNVNLPSIHPPTKSGELPFTFQPPFYSILPPRAENCPSYFNLPSTPSSRQERRTALHISTSLLFHPPAKSGELPFTYLSIEETTAAGWAGCGWAPGAGSGGATWETTWVLCEQKGKFTPRP